VGLLPHRTGCVAAKPELRLPNRQRPDLERAFAIASPSSPWGATTGRRCRNPLSTRHAIRRT
jgi:hypothetical protein